MLFLLCQLKCQTLVPIRQNKLDVRSPGLEKKEKVGTGFIAEVIQDQINYKIFPDYIVFICNNATMLHRIIELCLTLTRPAHARPVLAAALPKVCQIDHAYQTWAFSLSICSLCGYSTFELGHRTLIMRFYLKH